MGSSRLTLTSAVLLGGSVLVGPGTASADIFPDGWRPLPGSVQADIAQKAARQTATVYGTAASLERNVFPLLDYREVHFVFSIEQNWLANVAHVPMQTDNQIAYLRFQNAAMSTYAASIVLGVKVHENFSFFYGTSLATAFFPGATNDSRFITTSFVPLGLMFYQAPTAPLSVGRFKVLPSLGSSIFGISADYVLGGRVDVGGTSLYLGYLGSTLGDGVYTNVTQDKLRLLLAAAFGGATLNELLYLKAGFDRVKGLLSGKDLAEEEQKDREEIAGVSKTSLFVRRLQFLPPQPGVPDDSPADLRRVNFWTGHFEQLNIAGILDAKLAASPQPVLLHQATLAIHNKGFHENLKDNSGFWNGVRIAAGIVELPQMSYFAQQGGKKFLFELELKASVFANFAIRRNDPEILSVFPYAYDAWNIYVKMAFL